MVRRLGLDAFGIWAVLTAFTGYFAAIDLGLANAMVRFLAVEKERGDGGALESYLRSGVTLHLGLGLLLGWIFYLASPALATRWLTVPPSLVAETVASFRISALALFLAFPAVVYSAVPASLRRFDLLALRTVIFYSLQYLMVVGAIALGGGLFEVALVNVIGTALILFYLWRVSARLLPGLRVGPGWNGAAARRLLDFGRFKFASQLAIQLLQQFDRFALAAFLPVGRVSYYAIPVRLSQRVSQVVENIALPFYPAISSHLAAGRAAELRTQYLEGVRVVAAVAMGAVAVIGGLAGPLLFVWIGEDFAREGAICLRILLFAYAANALATLPSVAADAAGRPAISAAFNVTGSLLHVGAMVFWIPRMGLPGAALAVLLGFLVPLFLGVREIHRRVDSLPPVASFFRAMRGAVLAGIVSGALVIGFVSRSPFPRSGVIPLLVSLAAGSLLYFFLLLLFRGIGAEDFRRVVRLLRPAAVVDGGGAERAREIAVAPDRD